MLAETFVFEKTADDKDFFPKGVPKEKFKTLAEVKTWTKKNPKKTVIVLTLPWLPAR